MAGIATPDCMHSQQLKIAAVVEADSQKAGIRGLVAGFAGSGESCREVVGILSALVVALVAGITIPRRSLVDVVNMTGNAVLGCMRSQQLKIAAVVETDSQKAGIRCLVADFAGCRESRGDMVGILSALVIALVAGITIPRRSLIDVVNMTGSAVLGCMRSQQLKIAAVIGIGTRETKIRDAVTVIAGSRTSSGRVVRIQGAQVILYMAGITADRAAFEIPVGMT